jgi:hypothetical protein
VVCVLFRFYSSSIEIYIYLDFFGRFLIWYVFLSLDNHKICYAILFSD